MAHPYESVRQDKVEQDRARRLASGGSVAGKHPDIAADKSLVRKMVKSSALKADGGKGAKRLDRYARGGKVKDGKTNVNIVIATGKGKGEEQMPPMMAAPPLGPPPNPTMPPPMPPMPPGAGAGPPPMPMRKSGGRIKSGRAWEEGIKNGTPVEHLVGKNDLNKIDHSRAKLTRKRGGRIEAGKGMGPKMKAGSDTGEGRLEKTAMQKRK